MSAYRSAPPFDDPPSPCIGICVINPNTHLCEGCARTLDEIAAWWDYTSTQKHAVIAQLQDRQAQIMINGNLFD